MISAMDGTLTLEQIHARMASGGLAFLGTYLGSMTSNHESESMVNELGSN